MLLTDIRIIDATSYDLANALNTAMRFSKNTTDVLLKQTKAKKAQLTHRDIEKLYPPDTFVGANSKLERNIAIEMCKEIKKALGRQSKDIMNLTLLDFSKGFVKIIENAKKIGKKQYLS